MIGGMTGVLSDVIPFGLSMGNRNNLMGLNLIGLRRSNVSNENIKKIQSMYEIVFKSKNFRENIDSLDLDLKNNEFIKKIIHFINSDKKRPISLPPNIK
jgi:Acyl-[acyl carrier protein]--UDP-N-acetylglucosamine O-acyltransferase